MRDHTCEFFPSVLNLKRSDASVTGILTISGGGGAPVAT
jgi:hypothetical protein